MPVPFRTAGVLALAACVWIAADGARRAGAGAPLSRVYVPWDADRLPDSAPDTSILGLRPVSPFARFREALRRADGDDGPAFRASAEGVLRWGRNQPGVLLNLGQVALARWRAKGEAGDRAVGEALLLEFTRRTPRTPSEALRVWLRHAPSGDDPYVPFQGAPLSHAQEMGEFLAPTHPDAAWRFFEPSLRAGILSARAAGAVRETVRARGRRASDVAALEAFTRHEGAAADAREAIRAAVVDLAAGR